MKSESDDFESEVMPLLPQLYGGALRLTRDPDDAGDLVQETVLRAYRSWSSFTAGTNLKAWLYRIMTNLYISQYRASQRRGPQVSLDEATDFDLYRAMRESGRPETTPESDFFDALVDSDIQEALAALPDDFRMVVMLADGDGFSYKEIAEMLNIPIGTVMSRLHRGRKALQKALWELAVERGIVSREASE